MEKTVFHNCKYKASCPAYIATSCLVVIYVCTKHQNCSCLVFLRVFAATHGIYYIGHSCPFTHEFSSTYTVPNTYTCLQSCQNQHRKNMSLDMSSSASSETATKHAVTCLSLPRVVACSPQSLHRLGA